MFILNKYTHLCKSQKCKPKSYGVKVSYHRIQLKVKKVQNILSIHFYYTFHCSRQLIINIFWNYITGNYGHLHFVECFLEPSVFSSSVHANTQMTGVLAPKNIDGFQKHSTKPKTTKLLCSGSTNFLNIQNILYVRHQRIFHMARQACIKAIL